MARKKMSYGNYLDRYQQRDKEPKKYYKYMDMYNSNKKGNGMAYNKKKKKNNKNSGMISKDHNAPANLPQSEKHVMYSQPYYGKNGYVIKDTLAAQDYQISSDASDLFKGKKNGKYPEKY